jgi:hypothetical protein
MSQYFNRLRALNGNYVITHRGQDYSYRFIGQLIIKRVVTFNGYEAAFREFFVRNSYREWSGYFFKFNRDNRPNQNDLTVFVTFLNARDHLDFIRIFDNALFGQHSGLTKNIFVRVNGLTNQERNYDD